MTAAAAARRGQTPIRVMIVDDSAVVRGITKRWLVEDGFDVVGMAVDGQDGVRKAKELQPDVVVLDVEMPRLDGLAALPQILAAAPDAQVLMASTLTTRNATVTLQALHDGAADFVPKPDTGRLSGADAYRREIGGKVTALGERRARRAPARTGRATPVAAAAQRTPALSTTAATRAKPAQILAVGSSTGGPAALRTFIGAIGGRTGAPILVAQHMPATFTTILAEHLDKSSPAKAIEGQDGMPVRADHIYVAPGGFHMTVRKKAGGVVIALDQRPPVHFCRPAVDPLLDSVAQVYGANGLAVVLTGMGCDGRDGAAAMKKADARVFVQDEASSVVWGMPGAVAEAGHADAVATIPELSQLVLRAFKGRA